MTPMILLILLALIVGAPAGAALGPGTSLRMLDFGGVTRSYRARVPASYDGSAAVPLVLDLHGFTSNGQQQAAISGMGDVAEREGFIVVYPEGLNNAWNAGICCGNNGIDDVGFLRAVVAAVEGEANIDPTRVYATGLSNGGAMSQRLACDAADLFAAAAPMAFPIPFRPFSGCQPSRAIPVLTFMGLTDHLVLYDSGGLFPSAPGTFAYWRDIDGCGAADPDERVERGLSRCETYTQCTKGVQVGLCSITAQAFPGLPFDGHILYLNPDFDLAEVAWSFLSQFSLPDEPPPLHIGLSGPAILTMSGKRRLRGSLTWSVTLGDGTWSAEDAEHRVYTGSARGRRRAGRRLKLGLTGDSEATLLARIGDAVSQLAGIDSTVTLAKPPRLTARLFAGGVKLTGLVIVGSGATKARYAFRLIGKIAR